MQKFIFILFTSLILLGCDNIEDGLVDPNDGEFSVVDIQAPKSLEYVGADTKLTTSITFSDSKAIIVAWVQVSAQDGSFDITYRKEMSKANENQYSTSIGMTSEMPSTKYTIDYHYQTETQSDKKIASHDFTYDNMQNNIAPIISNPLFYYLDDEPTLLDTLENDKEFILSIKVTDGNGLSDIDSVYTDFYSPNNPSAIRVILFDDGKVAEHGDKIAGDGIYSLKNIFSGASGDRKFEFWARDRRGMLSNMITHNLVVK
jgi:hypothetical protein